MLIDKQVSALLSQEIIAAYNKLIKQLVLIKPEQRTIKILDATGGAVSVGDIVAYQIGWGISLLNWYKSGLAAIVPVMPGHGFAKWDYTSLARCFYETYQFDSALKQKQEFYAVVLSIISFVEQEYQLGNLDKLGIWPWCTLASGKQWPLSKWVKVNTVSAYKRANSLLKKLNLKKRVYINRAA